MSFWKERNILSHFVEEDNLQQSNTFYSILFNLMSFFLFVFIDTFLISFILSPYFISHITEISYITLKSPNILIFWYCNITPGLLPPNISDDSTSCPKSPPSSFNQKSVKATRAVLGHVFRYRILYGVTECLVLLPNDPHKPPPPPPSLSLVTDTRPCTCKGWLDL